MYKRVLALAKQYESDDTDSESEDNESSSRSFDHTGQHTEQSMYLLKTTVLAFTRQLCLFVSEHREQMKLSTQSIKIHVLYKLNKG